MLSMIVLNVIILNAVMLNVVMLNAVMLSVVVLCVWHPNFTSLKNKLNNFNRFFRWTWTTTRRQAKTTSLPASGFRRPEVKEDTFKSSMTPITEAEAGNGSLKNVKIMEQRVCLLMVRQIQLAVSLSAGQKVCSHKSHCH